jgi:cytochrome c-type biogenesis protein CcmF
MWPLVAEALTGRKVSVGPPFFDIAFTPFMVALAMILPLFSTLPWKRGSLGRAMQPLWGVLALSVALGALVWSLQTGGSMLGAGRRGARRLAGAGFALADDRNARPAARGAVAARPAARATCRAPTGARRIGHAGLGVT